MGFGRCDVGEDETRDERAHHHHSINDNEGAI